MDCLLKGNVIPSAPIVGGCATIPQSGLVASYLLQGTAESETGTFNGTESTATYAYNDERGIVYNGGGSITIPSTGGTYCVYWVNTGSGWTHYSGATIPSSLTTNKYSNLHIYNRTLSAGEITDIYNLEKYQHNNALDHGLVAYYPLDGNSLDNAINQYDGTDTSVTYVADGTFGIVLSCGAGNVSLPTATGTVETHYWEDTGVGWVHNTVASDVTSFTTNKYAHIRKYNRVISAKEKSILQDIEKQIICPSDKTIDNPDPFEDGSGIALYKMDGNVNDTTGVYNGTPTSITYANGIFGQTAVFNGSTSNVLLGSTVCEFGTGYFTISFWANHSTMATQDIIFQAGRAGDTATITFGTYNGLEGHTNLVYTLGKAITDAGISAGTVNNDGIFHHYILKRTGDVTELKVDDISKGTLAGHSAINVTSTYQTKLGCGEGTGGYGYFYPGNLDQCRVFNRATTTAEDTILYNERKE